MMIRQDDGFVCVGVHTGEVFLGPIIKGGNYQFSALGDAMNFAARLVTAA